MLISRHSQKVKDFKIRLGDNFVLVSLVEYFVCRYVGWNCSQFQSLFLERARKRQVEMNRNKNWTENNWIILFLQRRKFEILIQWMFSLSLSLVLFGFERQFLIRQGSSIKSGKKKRLDKSMHYRWQKAESNIWMVKVIWLRVLVVGTSWRLKQVDQIISYLINSPWSYQIYKLLTNQKFSIIHL